MFFPTLQLHTPWTILSTLKQSKPYIKLAGFDHSLSEYAAKVMIPSNCSLISAAESNYHSSDYIIQTQYTGNCGVYEASWSSSATEKKWKQAYTILADLELLAFVLTLNEDVVLDLEVDNSATE